MSSVGASRKSIWARFWQRTKSDRRPGIGSYLWLAHRISGFVLLVYLVAHLIVLGSILRGGASFDTLMSRLANPAVKVGEVILIWVALVHMFNGLRLVVLDLSFEASPRVLAYGVAAGTFGLGLAAAIYVW